MSFHNQRPFVHEFIVGDTLNVLCFCSITRFKKRLFPVRYLPTIDNIATGFFIDFKNYIDSGEILNFYSCK